jgi:peptidyl-prolyl cis-trans isomerase SurA
MGTSLLFRCLAGAILLAAAMLVPAPGRAQVVVVVNGSPITDYDIEQRSKLIATSTHTKPARQQVIQDLIDDQLKIAKAKTYGLEVSQAQVNSAFNGMAERQHVTVQQFIGLLARSGIAPETIKAQIKAQLTWNELVRGKFQAALQVGESDVDKALRERNETDVMGYIYTLYPVTVVIPAGSSEAVVAAKHKEAENLRATFTDCKTGLDFARALRDVAVREPITRSSGDLAPQLNALLGQMDIGHLTTPDVTAQGLQMFAVCDKKAAKTASPAEHALRNQIFAQRFEEQSSRYLRELRQQAMIEYKDAKGHDVNVEESK